MPTPFPQFNPLTDEMIVINPSKTELKEMESKKITGGGEPNLIIEDVILKYYEIDEKAGSPDWPSIPVTVGLPEGFDWVMAAEYKTKGEIITPMKENIVQPQNVITKTLRLK